MSATDLINNVLEKGDIEAGRICNQILEKLSGHGHAAFCEALSDYLAQQIFTILDERLNGGARPEV